MANVRDETSMAVRLAGGVKLLRRHSLAVPGILAIFFLSVLVLAVFHLTGGPFSWPVVLACIIGGYFALGVGANDVANTMGPVVGSRTLGIGAALAIAAICEASGAIFAGGDVVQTLSRDLIHADHPLSIDAFVLLMTSALLAAAIWIHLATLFGMPVSTTHSIVGSIVGGAVMAAGSEHVAWPVISAIALSWVVSPVLGALFAMLILLFIRWAILSRPDRVIAARYWVPLIVAFMSGVFTVYMTTKGLQRVIGFSLWQTLGLGLAATLAGFMLARPWVGRRSMTMENTRRQVAKLFTVPLIFAAALMSFAHGANDVANVVGPLAAIISAIGGQPNETGNVILPFWLLLIGALGIPLGLSLFGSGMIRSVGQKITNLDPIRAFCVALAATVTVLCAAALGLPVSSTYIAVGGIFGVGYLRERMINFGVQNPTVRPHTVLLEPSKLNRTPEDALREHLIHERRHLIRRKRVVAIAAAWAVTIPVTALLAGSIYAVLTVLSA